MTMQPNPYQPGGALQGDAYIARRADELLQDEIRSNKLFPYLLAARQSGKSSILARTQSVLTSSELSIAIVDFSAFGPEMLGSYNAFIGAFVAELLDEIGGAPSLRADLARIEKEPRFLLEAIRIIVKCSPGRLVICLDEIDVLAKCDFKDTFLGQIRALFNRRTREPELCRVQFVLSGAASPDHLITDLRQSPFNVGKEIRLDDLSSRAVDSLLLLGWRFNAPSIREASQLLADWTSGSVYLCQEILFRAYELCRDRAGRDYVPRAIELAVAELIQEAPGTIHFRNIETLLRSQPTLLNEWRAWVTGKPPGKRAITELAITGICSYESPFRNRLYARVFGSRGPLNLIDQQNATYRDGFSYDVFISHNSTDASVARGVAQRLRHDGIRVWFDEWEVRPGDNIARRIESGLEEARVLLICLSQNMNASDWASLEAATFRFRDPLDPHRRLIPLRLDRCQVRGFLSQYSFVSWTGVDHSEEYKRLLDACRPPLTPGMWRKPGGASILDKKVLDLRTSERIGAYWFIGHGESLLTGGDDGTLRLWNGGTGFCVHTFEGHKARIRAVACDAVGRVAASGSEDNTVRLWDLRSRSCLEVLTGHRDRVNSTALSPDGRLVLSGSNDNTLRLWDSNSGRCIRTFLGHTQEVVSVASKFDPPIAISGSRDKTVRVWDVNTGRCLRILEGHSHAIWYVALGADGRYAFSGSEDGTVRVWDLEAGSCVRVFSGHSDGVWCGALDTTLGIVVSGSRDRSVRLWNLGTGETIGCLEGHSAPVMGLTFDPVLEQMYSGDENGQVCTWDVSRLITDTETRRKSTSPLAPLADQVSYTNAKVLIVGDSGAGKTGLSMRLGLNHWKPSESTIGAWATQWRLPAPSDEKAQREIWLWDFGGQADQRLVHQLYMEDTALAILVFDGQRENAMEMLAQWDRDLERASRTPFVKLLVAGRADVGGLRVSRGEVERFAKEHGFVGYFETSAKTGSGCDELRTAITEGIRWLDIPWYSSPRLFRQLKDEIVRLKDEGRVLMRFTELRDALRLKAAGEVQLEFSDEQLRAVVGLLSGPGVVWELSFGGWVLLQPERINTFAQAVIQTIRLDELERGAIAEERVLSGNLAFPSSSPPLPAEEERFVLLAMHQALLERGLCLREYTESGPMLIFPSYYRRERPKLDQHPAELVVFRFSGFLDDVYSTLIVRLHHSKAFQHRKLWHHAADFRSLGGKHFGLKAERKSGGGEIALYFEPAVPPEEQIIFIRYVYEHLLEKARNVERLRLYVCPHCHTPVENRQLAMRRLSEGKRDIICASCERRVPLLDQLEELFLSSAMHGRVSELQERSERMMAKQSGERALVGEVISLASFAGQIARELTVSDHGIDMEIEFRDDLGQASGRKVYLQLKDGDGLGRRESDSLFRTRLRRNLSYWNRQPFPVVMLRRTEKGDVRWMDAREWSHKPENKSTPYSGSITAQGRSLDIEAILRWREAVLSSKPVS